MVRTEIGAAVLQARFHAVDQLVEIELVTRVVVDLQVHVFPTISPDFIPRGIERQQGKNGRIHSVLEISAAILRPFFLQISWHHGYLIRACAHGSFKSNPVGVGCGRIDISGRYVVQLWKAFDLIQTMLVSRTVIRKFDVFRVSNEWHIPVAEQSSIVRQVSIGPGILEPHIGVLERELQSNAGVGC